MRTVGLPLHGKSRSEAICESFYAGFLLMNAPIHKRVSFTTDGAPALTSKDVGLIGVGKTVSSRSTKACIPA